MVVLILLVAPPWFGKFLETQQEYELQMGMLKILVMFFCCFVMHEIPSGKTCTKWLSIVVSVVGIALAFNYIYAIANDSEPNRVIIVEQEDG